jgi:hypothetical protein
VGIAEHWLSDDDWANFRHSGHHLDAAAVIGELEANAPGAGSHHWACGAAGTSHTEGQMTRSAGQVAGRWRCERLDGPGHWMQLEAPSDVNPLLVEFLPAT